MPIGSGVTEAACKVLVKQRFCGSGMKWKEPGAAAVLSLRCLTYTNGVGRILGEDRQVWVPRGSMTTTLVLRSHPPGLEPCLAHQRPQLLEHLLEQHRACDRGYSQGEPLAVDDQIGGGIGEE